MNELAIIIAKYFIILSVLVAVFLLFRLRGKYKKLEYVFYIVVGGALCYLLAKLGGLLISDPRPFVVGHFTPLISHAADNGFPSDHTLLASFIGWVALYYSRKIGVIALILAALIGLARVYVGVHHLEDIIGSFVISGLAALAVGFTLNYWSKRKKAPVVAPKKY